MYKAGALPLGHHSESLIVEREGVVVPMGRLIEPSEHYGWMVKLKGHSVRRLSLSRLVDPSMKLESYR